MREHRHTEAQKQTFLLGEIAMITANANRGPGKPAFSQQDLMPWIKVKRIGRTPEQIKAAFLAYGAKIKDG